MKYIDADILRKEIEKERKSIEGLFIEGDNNFYDGQDDAYNHTLALIDSLQQEQNSIQDAELTGFESALFTAFSYAWQSYLRGEEVNVVQWAKENSAELLEAARCQQEQQEVNLEKEIETWIPAHISVRTDEILSANPTEIADACNEWGKCVARHFAEWQKQQMLKDAVECELYWDGDFLAIDLNMAALGYSERDKVKVIALKAEEE